MRKSQTALSEMCTFPQEGAGKERKESRGGEGICYRDTWAWTAEGKGPAVLQGKGLLVMGGQVALENNVGYHGWGVAYGMVSRAPCTPLHDPCCLLRSAIFDRGFVWIGFLFFGQGWWWWYTGWRSYGNI